MKRLAQLLLLLAVTAGLSCSGPQKKTKSKVKRPQPSLVFRSATVQVPPGQNYCEWKRNQEPTFTRKVIPLKVPENPKVGPHAKAKTRRILDRLPNRSTTPSDPK